MINIQNLQYLYDKNKGIQNINLQFNNNNCYAILGHNGAGKSTLFKCIVGVLSKQKGHINIDDFSYSKNEIEMKKQFYFIDDNPELVINLQVMEYFNIILDIYNIPFSNELQHQVDYYLKELEILDLKNAQMLEMSHGQKQKIEIILGLIIPTPVLILDEPLTGLDAYAQVKVMKFLTSIQNRIVLFSSHNLSITDKYVDNIVLIAKSQVLFSGSKNEFLNKYQNYGNNVEDIYLELYELEKS